MGFFKADILTDPTRIKILDDFFAEGLSVTWNSECCNKVNKDRFVFFYWYTLLTLSNFAIMASQNMISDFTLSSDLADQYSHLPPKYQSFFSKLFREIYDYLLPATRITSHGGVLFTYFLVNQQRKKYDLSVRDLDLLTLLYYHSSGGRDTIRTDRLKEQFPGISGRNFVALKHKGLISRRTFDPLAPHFQKHRSMRPIFIRMEPSAIILIRDVERDLRRALYQALKTNVTTTPMVTATNKQQE